eukprot:SAG25_NODE_473_length_7639_cov_9.447082_6_plen_976_part_00
MPRSDLRSQNVQLQQINQQCEQENQALRSRLVAEQTQKRAYRKRWKDARANGEAAAQQNPDRAADALALKQKNGKVARWVRDLVVKHVANGQPLDRALALAVDSYEAANIEVTGNVTKPGELATHCIVEHALMLLDVQLHHLAEHIREHARCGTPTDAAVAAVADAGDVPHPDDLTTTLDFLCDRSLDVPPPEDVDVGVIAGSTPDIELEEERGGCGLMWMSFDGSSQTRNNRAEIVLNLGGYEHAPKRGEFTCYLEEYSGESGPRVELVALLHKLREMRRRQDEMGIPKSEQIYLYDLPAAVGDNCSSNRGPNSGMITMIEIVRRHEFLFLRTIRPNMQRFVPTVFQSCQHHDSALVQVLMDFLRRQLDTEQPCPCSDRACAEWMVSDGEAGVRGQNTKECWSSNVARFLAGTFKKRDDWTTHLLHTTGDATGIPVVKTSRFWSVIIVAGDYLYPRIEEVQKFREKYISTLKAKQLGKTLNYAAQNWDLLDFDWLTDAVMYHSFHQPFNYGAEHNTADEQAKYIHDQVEYYQKMLPIPVTGAQAQANTTTAADALAVGADAQATAAANCALQAHWRLHALPRLVDRRLHEENRAAFRAHGQQRWGSLKYDHTAGRYKEAAVEARAQELLHGSARPGHVRQEALTVPELTPKLLERLRCMPLAIVDRLTKHLDSIVATGEAHPVISASGAVNENFLSEDAFRHWRRLYDRNVNTRAGIIEAIRRIKLAPVRHTYANPPEWADEPYLRGLSKRAHHTMRHVWPSRWDRARQRVEAMERSLAMEQAKQDRADLKAAKHKRDVEALLGGWLEMGGADGADRTRLAAGELLTWQHIVEHIVDLAEKGANGKNQTRRTGWGVAAIRNQLYLRNLRAAERSAAMAEALQEAGLIKSATGSINVTTSMKRGELKNILEQVLRVENKVRAEAVAAEDGGDGWDAAVAGDVPAPPRRSQRERARRPARYANTGDSPARQRPRHQ